MRLRSSQRSSHIADPRRALTIDRFEAVTGRRVTKPSLTGEEFVEYGLWFAGQVVPDVDPRRVTSVTATDGGLELALADGERAHVDRLIVAAGLSYFPRWPEPFAGAGLKGVSHTCEHPDLGVFADRRVAVIGSGQSAIESAALLHETGAEVEVIMRTPAVNWLAPAEPQLPARNGRRRRPGVPLPPTDIGGGGPRDAWVAATPDIWRRLDPDRRERVAFRCIRPAASAWLVPRTSAVRFTREARVTAVSEGEDGVSLSLDDGSERQVDHVLLGTGYEIDVRRYPFLDQTLAASLAVAGGYPVLGPGLESSVPGLHFVGAPAAGSFGPIMRFVVGSWYAGPAVTRRVLGGPRPPLRLSF
jgi:hypothetical protein